MFAGVALSWVLIATGKELATFCLDSLPAWKENWNRWKILCHSSFANFSWTGSNSDKDDHFIFHRRVFACQSRTRSNGILPSFQSLAKRVKWVGRSSSRPIPQERDQSRAFLRRRHWLGLDQNVCSLFALHSTSLRQRGDVAGLHFSWANLEINVHALLCRYSSLEGALRTLVLLRCRSIRMFLVSL